MGTLFKLKGFYSYDNCTNKKIEIKGQIKISENGLLKGIISCPKLDIPNQMISGRLYKEKDGSTNLSFIKAPSKNLSNIIYELKKSKGNSFQGKYSGIWRILPFKITLDYVLKKVDVKIETDIPKNKDSTEIILYKETIFTKSQ